MIIEKILEKKRESAKVFPVHANRASEIGHPCERYLVFLRTRWEERPPIEPELQMIFDLGRDIESRVMNDLREAGFEIIEQQRSFHWRDHNITGMIDGKILITNGEQKVYPFEVKSMSPFSFDSVDTIEDMKKSKYVYMQKYPVQLNTYLLMDAKDEGFFILKNKATGRMKEIKMSIDYDLGEKTLKKIESVNRHVAAGTVPEPIEYNELICDSCPFKHICNVNVERSEMVVNADPELEAKVVRLMALKSVVKEYEDLETELKRSLEGYRGIVGDFIIEGKWLDGTKYNVPDEIKKQYSAVYKYWRKSIKKI